MGDALFDAIVAHPDDDAPRLVWADREGGERGELVVIQCALTRGDLTNVERDRLVQRERELCERHWMRWSPFGIVARPIFRRGFVEAVEIPITRVARVHVAPPLVRELRLEDEARAMSEYAWRQLRDELARAFARIPVDHVLALGVSATIVRLYGESFATMLLETPALRGLRSMTIRVPLGATRDMSDLSWLTPHVRMAMPQLDVVIDDAW